MPGVWAWFRGALNFRVPHSRRGEAAGFGGAGFEPVGFCPCRDEPPRGLEACATKTPVHRLLPLNLRRAVCGVSSEPLGPTSQVQSETHRLKSVPLVAGKGESRIRKPAPLNNTRVRHPKIQNRSKAGAPATRPVQETLRNILPVEAAEEYISSQPVETHGRPDRNLEGSYEK
jgi:hypothetical protein